MTLCGPFDGDREEMDRRWVYSRTCDRCETMKARLSGLKPETLDLPPGTGN
jgi:hypothetical protein